jgi:hypothetical protein
MKAKDNFGGFSDTRLARRGLGDLSQVLKLKLQLLNQLGEPLCGERICGLQRQPAGLGELPVEFFAVSAVHRGAPAQ